MVCGILECDSLRASVRWVSLTFEPGSVCPKVTQRIRVVIRESATWILCRWNFHRTSRRPGAWPRPGHQETKIRVLVEPQNFGFFATLRSGPSWGCLLTRSFSTPHPLMDHKDSSQKRPKAWEAQTPTLESTMCTRAKQKKGAGLGNIFRVQKVRPQTSDPPEEQDPTFSSWTLQICVHSMVRTDHAESTLKSLTWTNHTWCPWYSCTSFSIIMNKLLMSLKYRALTWALRPLPFGSNWILNRCYQNCPIFIRNTRTRRLSSQQTKRSKNSEQNHVVFFHKEWTDKLVTFHVVEEPHSGFYCEV